MALYLRKVCTVLHLSSTVFVLFHNVFSRLLQRFLHTVVQFGCKEKLSLYNVTAIHICYCNNGENGFQCRCPARLRLCPFWPQEVYEVIRIENALKNREGYMIFQGGEYQ